MCSDGKTSCASGRWCIAKRQDVVGSDVNRFSHLHWCECVQVLEAGVESNTSADEEWHDTKAGSREMWDNYLKEKLREWIELHVEFAQKPDFYMVCGLKCCKLHFEVYVVDWMIMLTWRKLLDYLSAAARKQDDRQQQLKHRAVSHYPTVLKTL